MRIATGSFTNSMWPSITSWCPRRAICKARFPPVWRSNPPRITPRPCRIPWGIAQKTAQTQYTANITALQSRANVIAGSLSSLQTITSRAGELATSAVSSDTSSATLTTYADEVNNLISEVVTAANAKFRRRGSTCSAARLRDRAPYTTTTDANGSVTGVTYQGNSSVNQTQIGDGQTISVDIPGENTGTGGARGLITDSQSGADLLNHLIALRNDLNSGSTSAITPTARICRRTRII